MGIILIFSWAAHASGLPITIVYPNREGMDERATYPYAVLKLALDKSGVDYELKPTDSPMSDSRIRIALKTNQITVAWFGTSSEFESLFLPVRIPITRGILGYRLFVIHKDNQEKFSHIRSVAELAQLTAGQGFGWADIRILQHAGLKVVQSKFDSLFKMVNLKRIDYVPFGANEIFGFLDQRSHLMPNLHVEKKLVLIYPFDFYFFVNKSDQIMHNLIYQGLLKAYTDGSFNHLFNTHPDNQKFLTKAHLDQRRRLKIENPLMSKETSELPDKYFY